MSLGKVPMKAGGGAKRNVSIEQGTQVSKATQRAATTTRHRHTDKLSGDTYQPVYCTYHGEQGGREGKGQTAAQMHKIIRARNCTTSRASTRHLTLNKDTYVG